MDRAGLEIRETAEVDTAAIASLYPEAFPDEDLLPLVRDLLKDYQVALSLSAVIDHALVGHVILTKCSVAGSEVRAALIGPLAVNPRWQRQGIGSALVRAGIQRLKAANLDLVCVLGDPAYYCRLGFAAETRVEPPYRLPAEWCDAWQSRYLDSSTLRSCGKLIVPRQWRQDALWAP